MFPILTNTTTAFITIVNGVCTYENATNAARWAAEYGSDRGSSTHAGASPSPIQYRPSTTSRPVFYTGGAKTLAAGTVGALGAVALVVGLVL